MDRVLDENTNVRYLWLACCVRKQDERIPKQGNMSVYQNKETNEIEKKHWVRAEKRSEERVGTRLNFEPPDTLETSGGNSQRRLVKLKLKAMVLVGNHKHRRVN